MNMRMAEELATKRFTDMMASAGVDHQRMALEVLFFLPPDFVNIYRELWYKGIGGKDDGGSSGRGRSAEENGKLGKARVSSGGSLGDGRKQRIHVSSGGAKRKSYKEHWVVLDEDILRIKDKVDKRLRAVARDAREELHWVLEARRREAEEAAGGKAGAEDKAGEKTGAQSRAGGSTGAGTGATGRAARSTARCGGCGRIAGSGWKFCSYCGREIGQ